ncbi:AAA family ATPase [Solidesulfovibrio magneticus]|uniref:Uncharacterized protein n=1 Tax=Solidesulfovibrio magneticus (strain ATCC 700980 / DSM 13731 / RS-1) TaxID=573370 RepID=C4XTA0_SOLM1|nr:AAA family ATPase [Solidesulfovibrio magneticus]BAH75897.1 hypothetical protein DMR_24060 [Solidesulfovibrio magneticus RS-1]
MLLTVTARDLMSKTFPQQQFVIPDLLPVGLTILAGRPKTCKSFLALSLACGVAAGGIVLGKISVQQADVLFLSLEDGERRLQNRVRGMFGEDDVIPAGLHICTSPPKSSPLTGGTKESDLRDFLKSKPSVKLVVIDTLGKFRMDEQDAGHKQNDGGYAREVKSLSRLKAIADDHGVAILVVHHTRKQQAGDGDRFDNILGSTGIFATVDNAWILEKESSEPRGVLYTQSRDIEAMQLSMTISSGGVWSISDDSKLLQVSRERQEILDLLVESGSPMKCKELSLKLKKPEDSIRQTLCRMVNDGELSRVGRGLYAGPTGNSSHEVTSGDKAA